MLIIIYITYFNNIENIKRNTKIVLLCKCLLSIIIMIFFFYYYIYNEWDNEMNEINVFKSSVFLI